MTLLSRRAAFGLAAAAAVACGDIASSGSTRIALHAGRKLASRAAPSDPNAPNNTPPRCSDTPALKNGSNFGIHDRDLIQKYPSGTPMSTPTSASITPSPITSHASWLRRAPIALATLRVHRLAAEGDSILGDDPVAADELQEACALPDDHLLDSGSIGDRRRREVRPDHRRGSG